MLRGWFATIGRTGGDRSLPESVTWECVKDPSGEFLGRLFRRLDLDTSAEMNTWPEGIEFQDQRTGERLRFERGRLVEVKRPRWALRLEGRTIYTSSKPSVPASVLKRYNVRPDDERLEWRHEE